MNKRKVGAEYEQLASDYLAAHEYTVVERNLTTPYGEIDIIAQKDKTLHFVEVKSGTGFEPVYNLSKDKLAKLTKTLNIYLSQNRIYLAYCLSAVILSKDSKEGVFSVNWIENITAF